MMVISITALVVGMEEAGVGDIPFNEQNYVI
jgi:hypothetical protein